MHREFKRLLENATGEPEHVIAVNVDIRGFSAFCREVESADVAVFIKKVYKKLIDDYFQGAEFFKPTGDGLLIIIPYEEQILEYAAANTVTTCLNAVRDFPSFCADDRMINFKVPQKLGIGLSRGVACRLTSEGKTLDYSGRILNLASRLMDLARPSGIVFDAGFGIELVPNELMGLFSKDSVRLRGIAEEHPIEIYYTKDYTRIPTSLKEPLEKITWRRVFKKEKLKNFRHIGAVLYPLPSEPEDPKRIGVKIHFPMVIEGKRRKGERFRVDFPDFEYRMEVGKPQVGIKADPLVKVLEKHNVKDAWEFTIEIVYPEKSTSPDGGNAAKHC